MSSREYLIHEAESALEVQLEGGTDLAAMSKAVVDTLLPQIFSDKQMVGVPEGSILIVEVQAGARAVRWEDGHLHGKLRADGMPMDPKWVIERYGPMTLVWMP